MNSFFNEWWSRTGNNRITQRQSKIEQPRAIQKPKQIKPQEIDINRLSKPIFRLPEREKGSGDEQDDQNLELRLPQIQGMQELEGNLPISQGTHTVVRRYPNQRIHKIVQDVSSNTTPKKKS